MIKTINYIFVYGTLLDNGNEFAGYLKQHCSFYADGKLKGLLYDAGDYPAAIHQPNGDKYIYGKIFRLDNPEPVLTRLDDYEGFGPGQEQPNLFVRKMLEVESDNGSIECWVYLYNLGIDGFILIGSGNYLNYKNH